MTRQTGTALAKRVALGFSAGVLLTARWAYGLDVAVASSQTGPAPAGSVIHLAASTPGTSAQGFLYRFRARPWNGSFAVLRDWSENAVIDYTAGENDGTYEVETGVWNLDTGEIGSTLTDIQFTPRSFGRPVSNQTANPLVFLFSTPSCPVGASMRVDYYTTDQVLHSTPFKSCTTEANMSFYLAGLQSAAGYGAHWVLNNGGTLSFGNDTYFVTSAAPANLFKSSAALSSGPADAPVLLGSSLNGVAAFDRTGAPIWYANANVSYVTRAEGGTFWGLVMGPGDQWAQLIRKFDLAGNVLAETSAGRVNQQLAVLGKRQISAFHHEVRTLPDGKIVALGAVEQLLTGVQGLGQRDIIGDMVVVMDQYLNVLWTWDTFDFLDVTRAAVLGETCATAGACPTHYLATDANDWTHGNAVAPTADGNLIYSTRHQDWVIKIDYENGQGDGHIIWRLGNGGDFQLSGDASQWFSHQHDPNFDPADPGRLLLFDNGNTRVAKYGPGNSRGQVLRIDEKNRVASLELSVDLGKFSMAVGTAQKLPSGNYHFDAGFVVENGAQASYSYEITPGGTIVDLSRQVGILYRSWMLPDLYTAGN